MNEIMRRALADAMRPLVELIYKLEAKLAGKPHFEWGTITSIDPLRVRLDSHSTPLPDRPDCLVSGLREGDRVRVERQGTRVTVHGKANGATQKVLASGNNYMTAAQTWTLSEPISAQPSGIVLIFSAYAAGGATNQWSSHFIPKQAVAAVGSGLGWTFRPGLANGISKYLYISDTYITGYSANSTAPNDGQALRYVLGV